MTLGTLLPLVAAVLTLVIAWALVDGKPLEKPDSKLPASCTLSSASPEQRKLHRERLEALRKASRLISEDARGFTFFVDLSVMSVADLSIWMENEQKCCSFLSMTRRFREGDSVAEVEVTCTSEFRAEAMLTVGLMSTEKAR